MSENIKTSSESQFFKIINVAMTIPGVQIQRDDFLRKELSKYFKPEIVELAIQKNPASAGITKEQLEGIAKSCINYETNKVSIISTAAGIPGGLAMLGTVPADVAQYFGHIIRIVQKLIYLFGWKEIYSTDGAFDDETINLITLFVGVMFGVNAANTAISKIAKSAAINVEKTLVNRALTKGVIYPIVKNIASKLGIKMTKEIFAKTVGKIVPIISGIISGGITYASFKKSSERLSSHLKSLPTADVKFYERYREKAEDIDDTDNIIDVEFE